MYKIMYEWGRIRCERRCVKLLIGKKIIYKNRELLELVVLFAKLLKAVMIAHILENG